MKKIILLSLCLLILFNPLLAESPRLCAGVRGNGELVFAHWPSLARIVEHYGPIEVLAGGSSASISLFFYDSVSLNPVLSCPQRELGCMKQRSLEISLLLKSIEGYFDYWITTDEVNTVNALFGTSQELVKRLRFWVQESETEMERLKRFGGISTFFLVSKVRVLFSKLLNIKDLKKLLNKEANSFLQTAMDDYHSVPFWRVLTKYNKAKRVIFRFGEIVDSVKILVFGSFDAKNDKRLFFRPGIISFEDAASKFGRIGDFYAGYFYLDNLANRRSKDRQLYLEDMKSFLRECAVSGQGKSWEEISYTGEKEPELSMCGRMFRKTVSRFRTRLLQDEENKVIRKHRIHDLISSFQKNKSTGVFPITSVLTGGGAQKFDQWYNKYLLTTDKNFGLDFSIEYDQLRFGYWGKGEDLKQIQQTLMKKSTYQKDEKTKKMISLGRATWLEVLSLSAAEPGLSRLKHFTSKKELVSAGGWSDLHPTPLLRAFGCENIVYITRVNSEALFAQGVFKRLTGSKEPAWERIDPKGGDKTLALNNKGDKNDFDSPWGRLFNIANPDSSFSRSLNEADGVWCTDWDRFNLLNGYSPLTRHAYKEAKFFIHPKKNKKDRLLQQGAYGLPPIVQNRITKANNIVKAGKEWLSYTGCIPRSEKAATSY